MRRRDFIELLVRPSRGRLRRERNHRFPLSVFSVVARRQNLNATSLVFGRVCPKVDTSNIRMWLSSIAGQKINMTGYQR